MATGTQQIRRFHDPTQVWRRPSKKRLRIPTNDLYCQKLMHQYSPAGTYTDVSRYLITGQVNDGTVTVQHVSCQVVVDFNVLIAWPASITYLLYRCISPHTYIRSHYGVFLVTTHHQLLLPNSFFPTLFTLRAHLRPKVSKKDNLFYSIHHSLPNLIISLQLACKLTIPRAHDQSHKCLIKSWYCCIPPIISTLRRNKTFFSTSSSTHVCSVRYLN